MFFRAFILLLPFTSAYADNIFIALKSGLVFPKHTESRNELGERTRDISLNDGISYGLEMGYKKENWRASLTGHIRKKTDSEFGVLSDGDIEPIVGSFENLAVFGNGYFDFKDLLKSENINPFLHLGFGYSKTKVDQFSIPNRNFSIRGDADSGFGWILGVGIGWPLQNNLTLEIEYAVSDLGDWQTKLHPSTGRESGEYESKDLLLSLRFDFKELDSQVLWGN